ncbi:MAG: hypothetical protein WDO69_05580 [Pseudomonadota bacterium]
MMAALEVWDQQTWPSELRALFDDNFPSLEGFVTEERRIEDTRYGPTGWCRGARARPLNPFQRVHDEVLRRAQELASELSVVGYHCTRLHSDEIDHILSHGLEPLSKDLFERRVRARVLAGDISTDVGAGLLADNFVHDEEGTRLGRLFFLFTADLTRMDDFFSFWGGESLYTTHHGKQEMLLPLRTIGVPCIVEAVLPTDALCLWSDSMGERLYEAVLAHWGLREGAPGWEDSVADPVPADRIRRIIRLGDPVFARLTDCAAWSESELLSRWAI